MSIWKHYECEIIAKETPKVIRNCQKCKRSMEFYCSEKFRVNAQQKSIDVWLIYKCVHCDSTWNFPLLSRVHPNSMNQELHRKFMNNDREVAWEYAFQIGQLKKLCGGVNTEIQYMLTNEHIELGHGGVIFHLRSKYKFELRVDKVLAALLRVTRTELYRMNEQGTIVMNPPTDIRGKLKEDIQVTIK